MGPMDIHNLCKFTVLLLRPSLRSLDFPLFLVMDDAVSAVKQKLYVDREKLTILVNNNHQEGGRVCVCVWAWEPDCILVNMYDVSMFTMIQPWEKN